MLGVMREMPPAGRRASKTVLVAFLEEVVAFLVVEVCFPVLVMLAPPVSLAVLVEVFWATVLVAAVEVAAQDVSYSLWNVEV